MFVRVTAGQTSRPIRCREGVFTRLAVLMTHILHEIGELVPMTRREYARSAPARNRKRYHAACDSLQLKALVRRDGRIKWFVKSEKTERARWCPLEEWVKDVVARSICPRDPRYNVEVGRFIKPFEERLYHVFNDIFGAGTVCKGLNWSERGTVLFAKFISVHDCVIVCIDANRFDQHVGEAALRFEHSVYGAAYDGVPGVESLRRYLSWQLTNTGTAILPEGRIDFRLHGGRMSGDVNTSCGNVMLMVLMSIDLCNRIGTRPVIANDGDDTVFFLPRSCLSRFTKTISPHFAEYGFSVRVDQTTDTFEKLDFCQTRPVWTPYGYKMCRDPAKALGTDCVSVRDMPVKAIPKHRAAVAACGLAVASDMPLFRSYYKRMAEHQPDVKADLGIFGERNRELMEGTRNYHEITVETRNSFARAWGISPSIQVEMERVARSINFVDSFGSTSLCVDTAHTLALSRKNR